MSDTPQFLARRLLDEGEKTIHFFNQIHDDQWYLRIYVDDVEWNLHQLLAHFVSTEDSLLKLIIDIANGGEGAPEKFNIDRYNQKKVSKLESLPISELIKLFSQHRSAMVAYVSDLPPQALILQGRHPFLGVIPLTEIIKLVYRHNQLHQRDIRKLLSESA